MSKQTMNEILLFKENIYVNREIDEYAQNNLLVLPKGIKEVITIFWLSHQIIYKVIRRFLDK